jgi:glycine/D-amino acid oxidase-like deaminating enzyme
MGQAELQRRYDVVIVGGAIVGSAIAYFLARESGGRLSTLVVERDPSYARCSTSGSLSSIRQQFSRAENIAISQFGIGFIKSVVEHLAVDGEAPDLGFREPGYLVLADADGLGILETNHRLQRDLGAQIALMSPDELSRRFPWLSVEGLAGGALGLADEGWFDAYSLMIGFRKKAIALGVTYARDEVTGLERRGTRVAAAELTDGGRVEAGSVVNAAGPQARAVAAMAGIDLAVYCRKRSVFVFDCRTEIPDCPLVIDPTGVFVRPEGPAYVTGWSPPEAEDPDCEDFQVDWPLFEDKIWPVIARRVPAFEAIKATNAWACHYALNPLDHNAILGPHPEVENFVFANGFSGHGVQQSPAVGRGIAELLVHGRYMSLDLSPFDFARFAEGRLIRELNVF